LGDAFSGRIAATEIEHLFVGELGGVVVLANGQFPVAMAAFGSTVLVVVALGSKEQVLRAAAWRVVAAMQDAEPIRDRAVGQFPGQPVYEELALADA
jgi:hypothetical protein